MGFPVGGDSLLGRPGCLGMGCAASVDGQVNFYLHLLFWLGCFLVVTSPSGDVWLVWEYLLIFFYAFASLCSVAVLISILWFLERFLPLCLHDTDSQRLGAWLKW
jgi:hypothetical protein